MKFNQRGFFFTLGIVLLIIPLLFLIAFYTETSKTKTDDAIGKIRCDEVHYFVEDVRKDMTRAVAIFGRRAAIFAIDYLAVNGPLENYTFRCNDLCDVDCNKFSYNNNESRAAIAELILCGTINATNVTYMVNHTMREWSDKIQTRGEEMNMVVNITTTGITIVQISPWEFTTIIDAKFKVSDKAGMCFYRETPIEVMSNTSIIGLEDPLYLLATEGRSIKYIYDCYATINLTSLIIIKNDSLGSGNATGNVILYSTIQDESTETYCTDNGDSVNTKILIIDTAFGNCNSFEDICFNSSSQYHFAGVVDYNKNNPENSFVGKCGITIPWVWNSGDINLSDGDCISINNNTKSINLGTQSDKINTTCYYVSNITEYGGNYSVIYPNGPSFFDRLDGRYNLSDKYANQSKAYFNNTMIGIETFVDLYELLYLGILPYQNATWVDYLYWKNIPGNGVVGSCPSGPYTFKLDCPHMERYNYSALRGC